MTTPRVCVLRAPGTNCDVETAYAFEVSGADVDRVHLFRLLEDPAVLRAYQVLCIPGGFSFGDDIGAGVILASHLRGTLCDAISDFLTADKLILGICNGFQVLLKSGILPDGLNGWPPRDEQFSPATLTWNDNGKFTALWIRLRVESTANVFLRGISEIDLPIAHAEGKVVVCDDTLVDKWSRNGQLAACYRRWEVTGKRSCLATSETFISSSDSNSVSGGFRDVLPYPDNPNGSVANIAGLSDPSGRVLGLMPHPERFVHATQHPHWTRLRLSGTGDGLKLFDNAVEYFK